MPRQRGRYIAVVGICAAVVALPVGAAEAASSRPSPDSLIAITDCGEGLSITIGGSSLLHVGLPGDDCPTNSPSPTPSASPTGNPICTLPPPPTTPPPTTPIRTPALATTPPPPPTHAAASPIAQQAPQPIPTPPAPSPTPTTPTPTPVRTTPKPPPSTTLIVPSATTFHTVPFKPLNTVMIVLVIAIVPVSIARIRHRRR